MPQKIGQHFPFRSNLSIATVDGHKRVFTKGSSVTKWSAACPFLARKGLPGPDNGGQSGSSSGCSFPGYSRAPTRTLKKTRLRGRDSAGPLTEATRLYLYRAQSGEPLVTRSVRGSIFKAPIQALARRSGSHPGSAYIAPMHALAQITEANPVCFTWFAPRGPST